MEDYIWTVVGAGPAGIAAVGKLLDNGQNPEAIAWIDPLFRAGDLGAKWSNVSSNTKVSRFEAFLRDCESFNYSKTDAPFSIRRLDPNQTCQLYHIVEPLVWITDQLLKRVNSKKTKVLSLSFENMQWRVRVESEVITAKNVILAIGSKQKSLNYPKPEITLEYALDRGKLQKRVDRDETIAVFGSSHSAIMAIHNLLCAGVRQVINFYRSPVRYAVDYGDWILYDNTGLKGETAAWARGNIEREDLKGLLRVEANPENIGAYLPRCSRVVYGVGFEARTIPIDGVNPAGYNEKTGEIVPGLFGCGIAFPEKITDRAGNIEYNVGILKFIKYLDRVVPKWIEATKPAIEENRSEIQVLDDSPRN